MSRLTIYLVLVILSVFFIVADLHFSFIFGPFQKYLSGLATEVIGILITFTVVDSFLSYLDNKKHNKYRKQALRILGASFWNVGILVAQAIKASLDKIPANPGVDIPMILRSGYAKDLEHLDFIKDAPVVSKKAWVNRLSEEFKKEFAQVDSTITTYLLYLDIDFLEKVRELQKSTLVTFPQLAGGLMNNQRENYSAFPIYRGNANYLVEDMINLASIIEVIQNEKVYSTLDGLLPAFWEPNYGSKLGSARTNYASGKIFEGISIL
jgi:hypothetical protein